MTLWWSDSDTGLGAMVPSADFSGGIWSTDVSGILAFRHLLPGTWTAGSCALPDPPIFYADTGRVEAKAYLVSQGNTGPDCPVFINLLINQTSVRKMTVDPTSWASDILQVIDLGSVKLTRQEVLTVFLERGEGVAKDTVGVLGLWFGVSETGAD